MLFWEQNVESIDDLCMKGGIPSLHPQLLDELCIIYYEFMTQACSCPDPAFRLIVFCAQAAASTGEGLVLAQDCRPLLQYSVVSPDSYLSRSLDLVLN